ncbi:MAG: hypothetical protein ACRENX_02755 [Candidatus Dormibacteria bacterium]
MALAVAGAVVAAGFGYQLVGGIVAAVLVVGLAVVTVIHHRRTVEGRETGWWR